MSSDAATPPPPIIPKASSASPPPLISPPLPKAGPLTPGFGGAWRGIWLFTWRSRLVWRRLPVHLAIFLAIPVLVLLTVSQQFPSLLGDPRGDARELAGRMQRNNAQLERGQLGQIRGVFREAYGKVDSRWRRDHDPHSDERPSRVDLVEAVNSGINEITNQLRSVLTAGQRETFNGFIEEKRRDRIERVSSPDWGRIGPYYTWLMDFYFFMMLPLACVNAGGGLIREEIQADTLGFLTTRPLSRARLLVVKYLSLILWLQIAALLEVVLLGIAGGARGISGIGPLLALLIPVQILAVFAWGSLGLFLGQATRHYLVSAIVYGFVVELGIGNIPTNVNALSIMRNLASLLSRNEPLQRIYDWPTRGVSLSVVALLGATGVFVGLAAFLFTVREYNPTAEMQK